MILAREHTLRHTLLVVFLAGTAWGEVDFSRDVRPILASNCLKCHGLDDKARKAGLRLDDRDVATKPNKDDETAIVPGKPDKSALIERIFSKDEDEVMPPPSTKKTLTEDQKNTLKQWIAEGAKYQVHWAFVPPKQVPLPNVKQEGWAKNPIDRFILAKMEKEGLHPSPEADRYTLVRRVYLDLIGLPPTPEEADAFVNDPSPDSYEKLVDKLLASPHYGERWARRWLDLARYADTNGYEKDRQRSIWPYRDWVINALNQDMPFNQFTVEQIAGDMLPNATLQQKIATGFHRNTMLNEEGGIDPQEYRYYSLVDRVATTGITWLGLTIGCAQCHTHKFDPITHTDYYRFMALLNNADEPEMEVPSGEISAKRVEAEKKIDEAESKLPLKFPPPDSIFQNAGDQTKDAQGKIAQKQPDGSWIFQGQGSERETYTIDAEAGPTSIDRIRIEVLADHSSGPGRAPNGNFVLSELEVTVTPKDGSEPPQDVKIVRATADFAQPGFIVENAFDGKPNTGWAIDGQTHKDHAATFYFEEPVQYEHGAWWTIRLRQQYGGFHTIGKFRVSLGEKLTDPRPIEIRRAEAIEKTFSQWEKRESAKAVKWDLLRPTTMQSSKPSLVVLDDSSVLASGDLAKSITYDLTYPAHKKGITAVMLEVLPDPSLPKNGPGMVAYEGTFGDFFLSEITLQADGKPAKFAKGAQDFAAGALTAQSSIDGDPQTGWSIAGQTGKPHYAIFSLAQPLLDANQFQVHMLFERYFAAPLGRFRIWVTSDPKALDPASAMPSDVAAALSTPTPARSAAQKEVIFKYFLATTPELSEARKQIDKMRQALPKPPTTLVLRERPAQFGRVTHVHNRGEFLQEREVVTPGVPAFLPQIPAGEKPDRLALARWLVSETNPLTARVAVNRQWAAFFGAGIVRTTQDLGFQGDLPSHPELLDWLAVDFMKQGWSMKKLHRMIVTSATYRQSSKATPELLAKDPLNIDLARGPRFREEAEVVRDAALAESGLLSQKMGGPSVFPPQPPSVTTEGTYGPLPWNVSQGEDRYRRSLYTFAKRTAPFALYNTFDAPSGEACVARRDVTNTPLQALALLNDQVFGEIAQAMGKNIASLKASDEERARTMFRRCVTRPPTDQEVKMLVAFAQHQRQRMTKKEIDPAKIAGPGEGDPTERATWTAVARALLNLDEAITRS
jgi:hypothetical protein